MTKSGSTRTFELCSSQRGVCDDGYERCIQIAVTVEVGLPIGSQVRKDCRPIAIARRSCWGTFFRLGGPKLVIAVDR